MPSLPTSSARSDPGVTILRSTQQNPCSDSALGMRRQSAPPPPSPHCRWFCSVIPHFSLAQACRCCSLNTCVSGSWLQHSATSHAALRVSLSAGRMTAGASAAPRSQNATVLMLTFKLWKTACCRSKTPGPLTTGSLKSQVSRLLAQNFSLTKSRGCEVQGQKARNLT